MNPEEFFEEDTQWIRMHMNDINKEAHIIYNEMGKDCPYPDSWLWEENPSFLKKMALSTVIRLHLKEKWKERTIEMKLCDDCKEDSHPHNMKAFLVRGRKIAEEERTKMIECMTCHVSDCECPIRSIKTL